jgi:hypothetical protein
MLVREQGDTLHLLSVVSPAWLGAGDSIVVSDAPTTFGTVAFRLRVLGDTAATLSLTSSFTHAPRALVVHLPWFMQVRSAEADGRSVRVRDGALALSPRTHTVTLRWTRRAGDPALSYQATVEAYEHEYRQRWDRWVHGRQ